MSLFKILRGNSSRISTDVTPFHDGWCYYTSDDGGFYIDSEEEDGSQKRTRINPEGIASNQGTENAGKVLGVDENGDVVPVASVSAGSILKWGDLNGANG